MKKPILISVVVPAYNEEKYLGRCLSALKKQTLPKSSYEIIVVNNHSTDKTGLIGKKAGVKVVFEKKKGYVFALRAGCSQAQGKIIAITDADALVPPDWLEKIFQAYQADPGVVGVGGRTIHQPRFLLAILVEAFYNFCGWLFKSSPGFNLSVRKDAYQRIDGFRKEINFDTDLDLCLRLKRAGKMVFLWNNPVVASSRRFQSPGRAAYCFKALINIMALILFGKAVFFEFGEIRTAISGKGGKNS